jgi:Fe-S-cluster containining protein
MAEKMLCDKCNGKCCKYFALPIETPKTRGDYDDIRWYLCHKGISVFVEDGDWYVQIGNKCRHLTNGGHWCTIYKDRPRICRGYKTKECDRTEGEYDYELHFVNDRQMEEYMKMRFGGIPRVATRVRAACNNITKSRKNKHMVKGKKR